MWSDKRGGARVLDRILSVFVHLRAKLEKLRREKLISASGLFVLIFFTLLLVFKFALSSLC